MRGRHSYSSTSALERLFNIFLITIVIAVALIFSIFIGKFTSTYNNIVNFQEDVEDAKSNIQVVMQKRLDIIPNFVDTVKEFLKNEKQTYKDIANARELLAESFVTQNLDEIDEANNNLTSTVNKLIVIAEENPEITANEQYSSFIEQLENSVNAINEAKTEYNERVIEYNNSLKKFPADILSGVLGFKEIEILNVE